MISNQNMIMYQISGDERWLYFIRFEAMITCGSDGMGIGGRILSKYSNAPTYIVIA